MKKMLLIKIGVLMLLVSAFCLVPVSADTHGGSSLETQMLSDKAVYSPGGDITYTIWEDFVSTTGNNINHCYNVVFTLDSNIESITQNMPDYCSIIGNEVKCDGSLDMWMWSVASPYHDLLPVWHLNPSNPSGVFTITGKIKGGTPDGTTIKSSALFNCYLDHPEDSLPEPMSLIIDDKSASEVTVSTNKVPEFPSVILPATMIIGFLGVVFLIQRTREH